MSIIDHDKKDFAPQCGTLPLLGGFDGVEQLEETTDKKKKDQYDALKELGYTHELSEEGKDHFVRYSEGEISKANPYYIPVVNFLSIEKRADGSVRATYAVNNRINFKFDLFCGYTRAKTIALGAVIRWHRVSRKCAK